MRREIETQGFNLKTWYCCMEICNFYSVSPNEHSFSFFSWLLSNISGVPKQGEHWLCIQMYQVRCICTGMLMNVGIRRLAREEPCKKRLFFKKVLLCPTAKGQSLVHVQWVAEFLITVPKNLCPTIQIVGLKFAQWSGSASSSKHQRCTWHLRSTLQWLGIQLNALD